MTAKCVDAPLKTCDQDCMFALAPLPTPPPLLRHCLQNLLQYFKLAYVFSV